jgi:hypothetical protein
MDIRIIINALIIIFILHIFILNINYTVDIGSKKINEFFDNHRDKKDKEKKKSPKTEDSMNFLKESNDTSDEAFKKKLLKYMEEPNPVKLTDFEEKNLNKVEASNTYVSSDNVPNFESNVADISRFFKVNYDNLDENDLKATSIDTLKNISIEQDKDNANIQTVNVDIDSQKVLSQTPSQHYGRKSEVNPDTWSYKNELPMNGGNINGFVGFDSLESQFASFNPNKLNLQEADSPNFKNVTHDDLRKPIVYEN